ncbi:ABC transporter ATP-binding protein [Eubacteriales bacterium KG127]
MELNNKTKELENIVEFKNISMEFPGVLANEDVSLKIKKGEIFALVGENGAGKSTLMNILYGINTPTSGDLIIKGEKIDHFHPSTAISKGIGMVHQHFMLVPSFTVAQNIVLSKEPKKAGFIYDEKEAIKITEELVKEYGLTVNPADIIRETSVGIQQRVEILKTLYRGADVLILDEPTAVLTPKETEELFQVIKRVVKEIKMTVIIITHKLYEVMAISDRVGVMRQGKLVGVEETKNVNERTLASIMVGREILLDKITRTGKIGKCKIKVENLYVADNRGLPAVNGIDLEVHEGEILGIAAIEGNGQSELLEAITGMRHIESGKIFLGEKEITKLNPREIRSEGLAHIPEDRMATGVSGQSSILENIIIGKERKEEFAVKGIHLKQSSIVRYAKEMFQKFDIRGAGVNTPVESLSGGNMQKVVVAREFSYDTPALIIAQPTRGVDIGAMEFIHNKIIEKRNKGAAILLASADLDEVFRLSDRIITIFEGKITGEFKIGEISKMDIGFYMTGDRREKFEEV